MAVHNGRGGGLPYDFEVRDRPLDAGLDPVQVDRLETVDAMGFNAPAVRLQKHVGAEDRILTRDAVSHKGVGHKGDDHVPRDDVGYGRHTFISLFLFER